MRRLKRLAGLGAATAAALALTAAVAAADPGNGNGYGNWHRPGPVFVQTDSISGNAIAVYDRSPQGALTPAGTYATGGLGGRLEGSVVDHLASQGSLVLDRPDGLLLAVNAGSDTVSVFAVDGDHLSLRQTIGSGGTFPVSIAVHDGVVYVLNALSGGSLQGFRVFGGRLWPIPGSSRALGLDPKAEPQFVQTPGQVAFTPDGSKLLVTTKKNGEDLDVFAADHFGRLSAAPVVNPLPGTVPFAIEFDRFGRLVLAEAGTNALADFYVRWDGHIVPVSSAGTSQAATCWVVGADGRFYASNAGSASLSIFAESFGGGLSLAGQQATDAGTVDAAATPDGRFLYVQAGALGVVDGYAIAPDGSLTPVGSVTVPDAVGGEGIVAP